MITDYARSRFMRHKFGGEAFPALTNLYFGMLIGAATASTDGTEPSGGGYQRVAVPNLTTNFPDAVNGVKTHTNEIQFPRVTTNLGSVVQIGIWDAPVGGHLLMAASLPQPRTVTAGTSLLLRAGTLTFDWEADSKLSMLFRNEIFNHFLGGTTAPIVGTAHFAYTTTSCNATAAGTEPSGNGYQRKALATNRTNLPELTPGKLVNGIAISWPKATADQGTAVNVAVFDAPAAGNFLLWSVPPQPLVVTDQTIPEIEAGLFFMEIA